MTGADRRRAVVSVVTSVTSGCLAVCCAAVAAWSALSPPAAVVRLREHLRFARAPDGHWRVREVATRTVTVLRTPVERRRRAARWRTAVISLCDGISAELRAGRTPETALAQAVAVVDPVVAAALREGRPRGAVTIGAAARPGPAITPAVGAHTAEVSPGAWPEPKPEPVLPAEPAEPGDRPGTGAGTPAPIRLPCGVPAAPAAGRPLGTAQPEHASAPATALVPATGWLFGTDVPALLEQTSHRPGAGGLRLLAACWRIGAERGGTLALVLDGLAGTLRHEEALRQEVAAQLAGPRATARLLGGLPVLGLAMAAALGARPMAFLFGTLPGVSCLVAGIGLDLLGVWWTSRLTARAEAPVYTCRAPAGRGQA